MTTTSPQHTSDSQAGGDRDQPTTSTRSGRRAAMTFFRQAAPGGLLLRTGLLPDLGRHPVEQLLDPGGTDRRGGRGPADRGPAWPAEPGLTADPLAGQLGLVRARHRGAPVRPLRLHLGQRRAGRICAVTQHADPVVRPAAGHRPARHQPLRRPADGGAELPRIRPARTSEGSITTEGDGDHGRAGRRLAPAAVLHAGVRGASDRLRDHPRPHVLVRLVAQPRLRELVDHPDRARHGGR